MPDHTPKEKAKNKRNIVKAFKTRNKAKIKTGLKVLNKAKVKGRAAKARVKAKRKK